MIAEALLVSDNKVLLVRQHVQRGDIVWNFPGGGVETGETPDEACVREVLEETGYRIRVVELLHERNGKYTYVAEVVGGELRLDTEHEHNQDIVGVAWVSISDRLKFDAVTAPILDLYLRTRG